MPGDVETRGLEGARETALKSCRDLGPQHRSDEDELRVVYAAGDVGEYVIESRQIFRQVLTAEIDCCVRAQPKRFPAQRRRRDRRRNVGNAQIGKAYQSFG